MHIAILGCGQLARMMAMAGLPLGISFSFLAEENEDTRCVQHLGDIVRCKPSDNIDNLYAALGSPEIVTSEKEQVDLLRLRSLSDYCSVYPNPDAFEACHHRCNEKVLLQQLNIACAPYTFCETATASLAHFDLPMIAKSCSQGYDGKNQCHLDSIEDLKHFDSALTKTGIFSDDYIIEKKFHFDAEVSQLSVRSTDGDIQHYPLTENKHTQGILKKSVAPASCVSDKLTRMARDFITRIMEKLDYVGVLAMECFIIDGNLVVNELAPRVHNSGHWTQIGSRTCQFENHIRAIAGLPLGSTESVAAAGMLNLIGSNRPPLDLLSGNSKLHWYDKKVRPGRKLGHINVAGESTEQVIHYLRNYEDRAHVDLAG